MLCNFDVDLQLDWVRVLSNDLPEVGLVEQACRRGAVRHQEGAVPCVQMAGQHVDPW